MSPSRAAVAEMAKSNLGRKESSRLMSISPVLDVYGKGVRVDSLLDMLARVSNLLGQWKANNL